MITVNGATMTLEAVQPDGTQLDAFTITLA